MTVSHTDLSSSIVAAGAVGIVVVLAVLLIPVILIVANRAEPDQRGLRPFTVYLFAISFLAVLIGYAGSIVIVTGFVRLFSPHFLPIGNSVAQQCTVGGIVVVLAGLTLVYHLHRGVDIARTDDRVDGPNARVLHTYVSAVAFIVTAVVVMATASAVYLVFQLVAPGVFGGAGRSATGRALLDLFYVIVAGVIIVLAHLRYGPPRLLPGPLQPRMASPGPAPPPPPVMATAETVSQPAAQAGSAAPPPQRYDDTPLPPFVLSQTPEHPTAPGEPSRSEPPGEPPPSG